MDKKSDRTTKFTGLRHQAEDLLRTTKREVADRIFDEALRLRLTLHAAPVGRDGR